MNLRMHLKLAIVITIHLIFLTDVLSEHPAFKYRTLTWNMQGASAGNNINKWTSLEDLLKSTSQNKLDVIALQECGGVTSRINDGLVKRRHIIPPGIIEGMAGINQLLDYVPLFEHADKSEGGPYLTVHAPEIRGLNKANQRPGSGLSNVREYKWKIGTSSRSTDVYYVYHYSLNDLNTGKNDPNFRTNLAILSRFRADEVIVFKPNENLNRPVLAIRIGSVYFFSLHAPAYAKNPSAQIVIDIERYIVQKENYRVSISWIIMGDFNRNPKTQPLVMRNEITRQVVTTGMPTQNSGGEPDYAVVGAVRFINKPLMKAVLETKLRSDHTAVRFDPIN